MSKKLVTCNCTNLLHQIEGDKEDILQEHTSTPQGTKTKFVGVKSTPPPPNMKWVKRCYNYI